MFDPKRGYPGVVSYVRYVDPGAAITWLGEVLGAAEAVRLTLPDGRIGHAELRVGHGSVVAIGLASSPGSSEVPATRSAARAMTLVFVDDVDQATSRALALGGTLIDEASDMAWGLRQSVVADPEGHVWEVSTFLAEVSAADWGARITGAWFV